MCAAPPVGPSTQDHAKFFDHLVELVPPKHYYSDASQHLNLRFMAKEARRAAKAQMKAQYKQDKRAKLDPDQAMTTLDFQKRKLQLPQGGGAGAAAASDGPSTSQPAAGAASGEAQPQHQSALAPKLSGGFVSRQELLERLHKKIEDARAQRKAPADGEVRAPKQHDGGAPRAKQQQQQQGNKQQQHDKKQQQQGAGSKRKAPAPEAADGGVAHKGRQQQQQHEQQPAAKRPKQQGQQQGKADGSGDYTFARLELAPAAGKGGAAQRGPKRPPKELLLKQATARKAELEALAGTQEGKAKAREAAWQSALSRAKGEKVLDDPKLLKRTLKREAKARSKSAKAWRERATAQQEAQAARQAKRKENLGARRQAKVDNKKAKREKKLLRPGFEGRKDGFLGSSSPGAKGGAGPKARGGPQGKQ